jgi:hypothetical protein
VWVLGVGGGGGEGTFGPRRLCSMVVSTCSVLFSWVGVWG